MKSMKLIMESWREGSFLSEEKPKDTKKYDDSKKLKGDQDELPDELQKAIIKKGGGDPEEEEEEKKVDEANEGGEGVHDIFNLPEPEAVEPSGDPKVDALRQDTGLDVGVSDGAEVDRIESPQFIQRGVGQDLPGPLVALSAEVILGRFVHEAEFSGRSFQALQAFLNHFGSGAVARDDGDLVWQWCLQEI